MHGHNHAWGFGPAGADRELMQYTKFIPTNLHQLARDDHPPVSLAASRAHRGGLSDNTRWIELSEVHRTSPGGRRAEL